ncbi:MAG TPA: LacI family DNA-binding transcriptional regulator [Terriglobia bacterium]|nr:LacI family DNA-binding transcriptional regulator [Terriglobia bacterium]
MALQMKDVARRAGVSVTTVSHVMNKTRFVSPQTRQRVLEVIRELNYHKDAHARRLAVGRSDFFGLIVSDIENPFFPEIVKSFESAALEAGFDLLLCNTNYDPKRIKGAVHKMIENKVRGVAIMTSELATELAEELTANQVAVVFLDLGRVGHYKSNVRVNYSVGIYQAIEHLLDLGHTDIGFIAGPPTLRSSVIRREAFVNALSRRGLPAHRMLEGNHKVDGGIAAAGNLLAHGPLPSALLCSNDLTAIGVMSALHEAGLRVPEDISVIGFDDIEFARIAYPPLTTVNLSRDQVGRLAFQALQNILKNKKRLGAEYVVETQLVIRKSTARAPEHRAPARVTRVQDVPQPPTVP